MRNVTGMLALVVSAAAVAGCGGGGSSTPLTEDDFCAQKAAKECQVTAKCGTMVSSCVAQRKTKCLMVVASTKTVTRVFRPENVPGCINKTNTVYGLATIKPTDLADMDDVCAYVFQGSSSDACSVKYDCAGGVNAKICDKGQCKAKMVTNKGSGCANAGQVCAVGAYCADDPMTTAADLTCLGKAAQSATCSDTVPCLETFRCDAATSTCMTRLGSGESCTSSDDCAPSTPFCDPYLNGKCDLGLSFAAGASSCVDYGGTGTPTGSGGSSGGGVGGTTGNVDASAG